MFEHDSHPPSRTGSDLESAFEVLGGDADDDATEAELVEEVALLERHKAAAAARQARTAARLAAKRAAREAAAGIPANKRCQGLAVELALARRTSPHRAARDLGFAKVLVTELPHTHALLARGEISEWRAILVARETATLSREHREQVDAELADKLGCLGDREAAAKAREIGYRLDPGSAVRRSRRARSDRHVTLRPAPDTMGYLTALLPVEQAVACLAALRRAADTARSDGVEGDHRSRGQVMADTLVERLTGQTRASDVDVEVQVVMTDSTLLTDDPTPAQIISYGPIHAALARQIVRDARRAWLRRLYLHPDRTTLVAMDSHRRRFDGRLRHYLIIRDQLCRTPWCDAPISHVDHPTRVADGGETTVENGQGLCEACNYAKEAPGWRARALPGHRHRIQVTTPTGHTYISDAPDPPHAPVPPPEEDEGDFAHFYSSPRSPDEELRLLLAGASS